jgi:hypothetical protein
VLPGNSSVNTVQHATTGETVFSVSAVTSPIDGWWSRDMFPVMRVQWVTATLSSGIKRQGRDADH